MFRLIKQFKKSFKAAKKKNWDKIYILVDIHDTCMPSTYSDEPSTEFYPLALSTLQLMSKRKDLCLILWTCSNEINLQKYLKFFSERGVNFHYANANPEVQDKHYADYSKKFYTNVILDDKAGFVPSDWYSLYFYFKFL